MVGTPPFAWIRASRPARPHSPYRVNAAARPEPRSPPPPPEEGVEDALRSRPCRVSVRRVASKSGFARTAPRGVSPPSGGEERLRSLLRPSGVPAGVRRVVFADVRCGSLTHPGIVGIARKRRCHRAFRAAAEAGDPGIEPGVAVLETA